MIYTFYMFCTDKTKAESKVTPTSFRTVISQPSLPITSGGTR